MTMRPDPALQRLERFGETAKGILRQQKTAGQVGRAAHESTRPSRRGYNRGIPRTAFAELGSLGHLTYRHEHS